MVLGVRLVNLLWLIRGMRIVFTGLVVGGLLGKLGIFDHPTILSSILQVIIGFAR
jgi:hypothetical protein